MGVFTVPTVRFYMDGKLAVDESGYFSLDRMLDRAERYLKMLSDGADSRVQPGTNEQEAGMEVYEALTLLRDKAVRDPALRKSLLETRHSRTPISDFCRIRVEYISVMTH